MKTKENKGNVASRRKALRNIAGVSAIATIWHKPALESVILPAHAQTSMVDFFASNATATSANVAKANSILDHIIPTANARLYSPNLANYRFSAEAIQQSGQNYYVKIVAEEIIQNNRLAPSSTYEYGWDGTLSGSTAGTLAGTGCASSESAKIVSISGAQLVIEMGFEGLNINLTLNPGTITLPSFPLFCQTV